MSRRNKNGSNGAGDDFNPDQGNGGSGIQDSGERRSFQVTSDTSSSLGQRFVANDAAYKNLVVPSIDIIQGGKAPFNFAGNTELSPNSLHDTPGIIVSYMQVGPGSGEALNEVTRILYQNIRKRSNATLPFEASDLGMVVFYFAGVYAEYTALKRALNLSVTFNATNRYMPYAIAAASLGWENPTSLAAQFEEDDYSYQKKCCEWMNRIARLLNAFNIPSGVFNFFDEIVDMFQNIYTADSDSGVTDYYVMTPNNYYSFGTDDNGTRLTCVFNHTNSDAYTETNLLQRIKNLYDNVYDTYNYQDVAIILGELGKAQFDTYYTFHTDLVPEDLSPTECTVNNDTAMLSMFRNMEAMPVIHKGDGWIPGGKLDQPAVKGDSNKTVYDDMVDIFQDGSGKIMYDPCFFPQYLRTQNGIVTSSVSNTFNMDRMVTFSSENPTMDEYLRAIHAKLPMQKDVYDINSGADYQFNVYRPLTGSLPIAYCVKMCLAVTYYSPNASGYKAYYNKDFWTQIVLTPETNIGGSYTSTAELFSSWKEVIRFLGMILRMEHAPQMIWMDKVNQIGGQIGPAAAYKIISATTIADFHESEVLGMWSLDKLAATTSK